MPTWEDIKPPTTTPRQSYQDLLDTLSRNGWEDRRQEVLTLQAQATGYVWGWQDAGGADRDTQVSIDFGVAYGKHAAEYALAMRGWRSNIADAFRKWRESGEIN